MVTIKDIANKLGIAVSTVSKGLNNASDISEEMRQLVLDTAIEMGYTSKKMKDSGNRKVCILIENMDYENIDQFGYEIIVGFKLAAARRKWDVHVVPTNLNMQTEEKYDTYMLRNNFSGAFLLGFTLHDDWVKQLNKTNFPTVLLDNYIERNPHVGYVGTDNYEGIDLAVNHLCKLGHKKIAFLNGSKNSMVSEQRRQAFVNSMIKHGLVPEEELIQYGYYVPDCAKDHVPSFLKKGATAIMCASDLIATGVMTEVSKHGLKIPDDISIVGFDDLPIASQLSPALTTIRQDRRDLGKSAFLLLDGLVHGVSTSKLLLRAKLITRESSGSAKY
ncbi:LacI family DNA-binding transcriptional regulator [Herbinix luporum]|jgi:LacI family transcriptional regulator|uniref:LacI family DNA-binding transcriptional regulator n=1 Tax=Herbinix luporum TaxID=1679721 RepID=UPI001767485C|nr:LacI family DNA-binding transcriptional regulator [Herbinix luporum]MDI9488791.1 LacI family DNA-binding transcriptional regulator [Bacillota bacterium]HHT57278.1 LacI family transcriptional regulator [Herbinix luporum]